MVWKKASEQQVGGNYTWWDAEQDSPLLLPLLYCIGNAIPHQPLDYFLRGLFTDDELAPGGGDPGWAWHRHMRADGTLAYRVWTHEEVSGLECNEGEYDEATVKHHIYRTLLNFAEARPEHGDEVREVIARYHLQLKDGAAYGGGAQ